MSSANYLSIIQKFREHLSFRTSIPTRRLIHRGQMQLFYNPEAIFTGLGYGKFPWFLALECIIAFHDDVIKWKNFPRYWPIVRGIHRSPVNSPPKGQWRGTLMFSLICVSINGWVNNREAGDLRRYRAHYDVIIMPRGRCVDNDLYKQTPGWYSTSLPTMMQHIIKCGSICEQMTGAHNKIASV